MIEKISQDIDQAEKNLKQALTDAQIVEEEILLLSRDILDLQRRKKDLQITESKARHNVKQITIELRMLKNAVWNEKQGG